jgi:hypothetical protein
MNDLSLNTGKGVGAERDYEVCYNGIVQLNVVGQSNRIFANEYELREESEYQKTRLCCTSLRYMP